MVKEVQDQTPNSTMQSVGNVDNARMWKYLEGINNKLLTIELQLSEVVRLEERVRSQGEVLSRYGMRLDNHGARVRELELWQAQYGDKESMVAI